MMVTQIYDGDTTNSTLAQYICNSSNYTKPTVSSGQYLTIQLNKPIRTLNPVHLKAFYTTFDNSCDGDVFAESGYITSPNYPSSYPSNIECIWTIGVSPGNKIRLAILNLNIVQTPSCNVDYLEIRETTEDGRLLNVLCGSNDYFGEILGSGIWMKFRSGIIGTAQGFQLRFDYRM